MLKILTAADKILIGTVIFIIVASFFTLSAFSVQGSRFRSGDLIVCVPNKTVVRIMGDKAEEIKAITG